MSRRVLHIFKSSVRKPKFHFLGSTKDIAGRTEYFDSRGFEIDELVTERHDDNSLMKALDGQDMRRYDVVVIEYPRFPNAVRWIKSQNPQTRVLVRGHNAELLHQTHILMAEAMVAPHLSPRQLAARWRPVARTARDIVVKGLADRTSVQAADGVLSISDWESEHYWPKRTSREQIHTVPYFLPTKYREPYDRAEQRLPICICLTAAAMNPMVAMAARNFSRHVRQLGSRLPKWSFRVTGEVPPRLLYDTDRVERLGLVDDPLKTMRNASAMALLSSLGTGFKTKIMDAIEQGCYTLVPPRLFDRLPPEIHPYCLQVKSGSTDQFVAALEKSLSPFPSGSPNERLRERAFAALDRAVGL